MEVKKINLAIFGKSFCISTDENEKDVHMASELVDSLMKKLAEKVPGKDESQIAILVALQFAIDLTKNCKQLDSCKMEMANLIELLKNNIEQ